MSERGRKAGAYQICRPPVGPCELRRRAGGGDIAVCRQRGGGADPPATHPPERRGDPARRCRLFRHGQFRRRNPDAEYRCARSEEHTSELQVTNAHLVCRLLLEKKKETGENKLI